MGRRPLILLTVMVALALAVISAAPLLERVPELIVPVLVVYWLLFVLVFRGVMGRPLGGEVLAAAGLTPRPVRRGWAGRTSVFLFKAAMALCFVLASAAAALWGRSHRVEDKVFSNRWTVLSVTRSRWVRRFNDGLLVVSGRGSLAIDHHRAVQVDPRYVLNKTSTFRLVPWHEFSWTDDRALRATGVTPPVTPTPTRAPATPSPVLDALGIEYSRSVSPGGLPGDPAEGDTWLVVPWRLICLALAAPPLCAAAVALVRLRKAKPGHCRHCGYDLRASTGRCPECGEETAPAAGRVPAAAGES